MTTLAVAGLFLGAALILAGLGLATGMGKIRDARRYLDSSTPLYDRTIDDLGFTPDRPFSAGDETDVVEALRLISDGIDPADPAFVAQTREWLLDEAHKQSQRANVVELARRGGYVRGQQR